jgi:hypothetical protein
MTRLKSFTIACCNVLAAQELKNGRWLLLDCRSTWQGNKSGRQFIASVSRAFAFHPAGMSSGDPSTDENFPSQSFFELGSRKSNILNGVVVPTGKDSDRNSSFLLEMTLRLG